MKRETFDEFVPLLMKHYDNVVARMETRAKAHAKKVSRRALIQRYLETRDERSVAAEFGVSKTRVNQLIAYSLRIARELEGELPKPRRKVSA